MDNLAKEAVLARSAGMSYGKWKAMQNPTKIEKKADPNERRCRNCGEIIVQKTNRSRFYCGAYCGYQYRERIARENGDYKVLGYGTRNCPICGKEFTPKTQGNKYCSRDCANKGKVKTMKDWQAMNRGKDRG